MEKRISIILLIVCCSLLGFGQMSPQTKSITKKFFPDPEIEINTPAFQKKRGFTNYEELMAFLNQEQANHSDVMSISFIGKSQKGVDIPLVKLNKKGTENKLRIWLQAGLHGNEPGSTEGILYLIDQLLNNAEYAHLLDQLEIAIVPVANIDGSEIQNRYSDNGLDLNRDQTKLLAPESVVLKKAFSDFSAHVAVDFHEYRPYRRDFTKMSTYGVTNYFDVMFLYSGNHNVPETLRYYTKEKFVANAAKELSDHALTSHDYFSESKVLGAIEFHQGSLNSRSSATSYALSNCIASLIEVRGIGIGKTSFKRRTYSAFLVALSYLKTTVENADEVRLTIAKANATEDDAVVEHQRELEERPLTFIDLETTEKITLQVRMKDAWLAKPKLRRNSPVAYILLPTQKEVVAKLQILGLKIDTLNQEKTVEVEKYTVATYEQEPEKYEGVNRQNVTTALEATEKAFPAGSFIVYMNQPKANLAIEVMEPEAPNSFVTFDQIHTALNEELPIYRYLNQEAL
tara:strand:- start:526 stop:2070 length:1545 start_codon:yes stop_codon:yes gene_type:complete